MTGLLGARYGSFRRRTSPWASVRVGHNCGIADEVLPHRALVHLARRPTCRMYEAPRGAPVLRRPGCPAVPRRRRLGNEASITSGSLADHQAMSNSEIANRRIGFSEGPGVVIMAIDARRRQARQVVPRPRVVQFSLTEEEFAEVSVAARRCGLARGAFAAEATAYGPDNPWYRRATASGAGRIRAGSIERDVSFAHAAPEAQTGIDAAYHAEYDRYGPRIVGPLTGSGAYGVTVRLAPQPDREK